MDKPKYKKESDAVSADKEKKEKNNSQRDLLQSLDKKQIERYDLAINRLTNAREQRQQTREEFDGLSYEEDYFYNKKAGNAFLPPKLNDDEVRVNTGTIEKKVEVLMNELLSMNLQPEGNVYDHEDNEIVNLGKDFIDIVKRTNEIEKDDDFYIDALREMLVQRTFFIQDLCVSKKYKTVTIKRAEKRLISGLRVYLGDINIPARLFQTQPYIALYTRRNYDEAKTIYGSWERWEYVTPGSGTATKDTPFGYRMNTITNNEVEEIHVIDPINNEYEIIINGIPMCVEPMECNWTITPDQRYNMTQIIIKPLDTDFAYGKQPVASAKFLQGFKDESIRLLIRKFRQAVEPPLAMKRKIVSKDIWSPGSITHGIKKDEFEQLISHTGVTASEYNMLDLIEKKTEEFIGAGSLQQGISNGGEQTATEVQQLQVNSIKNLGLIVAAFMRLKRDATYLRIYTIADKLVSPKRREYDVLTQKMNDVFSRFTINDVIFPNGLKGKKIVQFTNSPLTQTEKENMYAYEQKEAQAGRPIQLRTINVKLLQSIPLFWKVTVNPQPRDGSQLQKVLFKDKLTQGIGIEQASQGQKKVNWERAAEDFERTWESKDFFRKEAPQDLQGGQAPQQGENKGEELLKDIDNFERTEAGSQMTEVLRRPNQAPSINRIENNVG